MLENATDPNSLSIQLTEAVNYQLGLDEKETDTKIELSLISLTDVHFLQNASAQQSVTLLSWIAILILSIALINFINLSIVQSLDKARQVGVRKILGAFQNQIIRQSATETMVLYGIALVLAIALIILFRPLLSDIIYIPFSFNYLYFTHWSVLLLLFGRSNCICFVYSSIYSLLQACSGIERKIQTQ